MERGPLLGQTQGGLDVVALGPFEGPLGDFVKQLKYHQETLLGAHLGCAMGRLLPMSWRQAVLVPVPLHDARLVERGYNQSALLARSAATSSRARVDFSILKRWRPTQAQAKLSRQDRNQNVRAAFALDGSFLRRAEPIVLVDDVVTTGATLDACAEALRLGGYDVLGALGCCLARDVSPDEVQPNHSASQNTVNASPPSSRSAGRLNSTAS